MCTNAEPYNSKVPLSWVDFSWSVKSCRWSTKSIIKNPHTHTQEKKKKNNSLGGVEQLDLYHPNHKLLNFFLFFILGPK